MLIPFGDLLKEFAIHPRGVLHLGASSGQEANQYFLCGLHHMVFIEALPDVFKHLQANISRFPYAKAINACIGPIDGEKRIFHVSSNGGESSSLFEFGTHAQMHPDVTFTHDIEVTTTKMSTLIRENHIDVEAYDFLNVDLQGAELIALESMEEYLLKFKYIYIEVNTDYLYKGIPLIDDIDGYLARYGFVRKKEKITDFGWGDAFYMKVMPI